MKQILLLTLIVLSPSTAAMAQESRGSLYYSSMGGAYSVAPILTEKKESSLEITIAGLAKQIDSFHATLKPLSIADTIDVPRQTVILGGLIKYPEISPAQAQAKVARATIKRLTREMKILESEHEKVTKQLRKLRHNDEHLVQVRLLWGFATWEKPKADGNQQ